MRCDIFADFENARSYSLELRLTCCLLHCKAYGETLTRAIKI